MLEQKQTQALPRTSRAYYLDNLRFLLILSVVVGHLLEIKWFAGSVFLYRVIYSFHMPALIFLFGCFVKQNGKGILFRWVIPYLVFQTLYLLFNQKVLEQNVTIQYTTPNWILWYLLACIAYQLLWPMYDAKNPVTQVILLASAVAVALAVGQDKTVGYYMALSRILVFLPWFLLGVYFRKNDGFRLLSGRKLWLCIAALIALIPALWSTGWLTEQKIPVSLLYGSYSYSAAKAALWMRAAQMGIALAWLVLLCVLSKLVLDWKIPLITHIGQNTLPVFLLHGFAVKAIGKFHPEWADSLGKVLLLSCLMVVLLGNKWMKKLVDFVGLKWLEKLLPYDG